MSTVETVTPEDVVAAIIGADAATLVQFEQACRSRRAYLAQSNRFTLKAGTRVVTSGLRPGYMNGLVATVVKVNTTTAEVTFDPDQNLGRFQGARGVRCPLTALTPITHLEA